MMGHKAKLELGEHRISREISELNLSKTSSSGQYAEGVMSKLHDPDKRWQVDTFAVVSE